MSATLVATGGVPDEAPRVAWRIADGVRRHALARDFLAASETEADVLVIELALGAALPADAAAFDGALLVLTDDVSLATDAAIPGVLRHDASAVQIAAAVAALAAGLAVRWPGWASEREGFAAQPAAPKLLTPREVEVLAAVGDGLSNKAIARRLGISAHTVKYHLEAVFLKLGVRSRAEAVTRGLRLGVHFL